MTPRTLVVGGGLAGLLAARRRLAAGDDVLVLEGEDVVGGAIAEAEVLPGLPINAGAEAYSLGSGAVDALIADLGTTSIAETAVVSPRSGLGSRIVSAGGVHRAPADALLGVPAHPLAADVRAVLGVPGALRAALERFLPARVGDRPGATVAELVTARCGRRVTDRLVAPIVGGVHSSDPATLEFAAASPALLSGLREHGSLTAAVRAVRGRSTRSAGTRVHALDPTMAELPRALAAGIRAAGGEIRTGTRAVAVERETGTIRMTGAARTPAWTVTTAAGETLGGDRLILACPPDLARDLLEGPAPDIARAIPEAPSSTVRLVALVLDAPALDALPSGTGALVAPGTPGITAKALTHASAKWEHVERLARTALPEARSPHVVRLSYGRPGQELPAREDIVDLALADASLVLGAPLGREQLLASRIVDWDRAMRQALPGHRAALAALEDLLAAEPDLELVGSWRAGTGIDAIVRADAAASTAAPRTSPLPEGTGS
ncbi:protoporphyrinogen/coproporphyrinogen oxidase [Brachybacterium sp. DNPG3]